MKINEVIVNEGVISNLMMHLQGRQLGKRNTLLDTIRELKSQSKNLPMDEQRRAFMLIDRLTKQLVHKEYVAAKTTHDNIQGLLGQYGSR